MRRVNRFLPALGAVAVLTLTYCRGPDKPDKQSAPTAGVNPARTADAGRGTTPAPARLQIASSGRLPQSIRRLRLGMALPDALAVDDTLKPLSPEKTLSELQSERWFMVTSADPLCDGCLRLEAEC